MHSISVRSSSGLAPHILLATFRNHRRDMLTDPLSLSVSLNDLKEGVTFFPEIKLNTFSSLSLIKSLTGLGYSHVEVVFFREVLEKSTSLMGSYDVNRLRMYIQS